MSEDVRREDARVDERDRRGDEGRVDDQPVRDDTDELQYTEHRPEAHHDDAGVTADDRAVRSDDVDAGVRDDTMERTADRDIDRDPSSQRQAAAGPGASTSWNDDGLLNSDDRGSYQQRWDDIQVRFIDEPRQCVREADDLVGEVTKRISERFSGARQDMEQRWDGGNEPTTEELRQAVQRYRDFFQRLVAQ